MRRLAFLVALAACGRDARDAFVDDGDGGTWDLDGGYRAGVFRADAKLKGCDSGLCLRTIEGSYSVCAVHEGPIGCE